MSSPPEPSTPPEVSVQRVLRLWWPLALSWLFMALELPLVTMAVARLPNAEVNLAAHGGVVLPVSLIIEAPIIMLLAASTALCRDAAAWRLVHRFMMVAGALLTAVHACVAFTPLHDWLVLDVVGAPAAVTEPARIGLQLMLPWTWSIAYRRFHQGVLIRSGRSRPVAVGTIVRLGANTTVLVAGLLHGGFSGIAVGAAGIAAGVLAEAAFIGWQVRPSLAALPEADPAGEPLTLRGFASFYAPLAATQLLSLALPPISAAAMSRMPDPLTSLAAWPAAWGLAFLMRSVSYAFNEVVVTLLDEPGAHAALRRSARGLALGTTVALVLFVATPMAAFWFGRISGLPPELVTTCRFALLLATLQPLLSAYEMWFQGRLVHARRTRSVTVGMLIHLSTATIAYSIGIAWQPAPGIHVAMVTLTLAAACKTAWLGYRAGRETGTRVESDERVRTNAN